jgi:hypothetical protein
VCVTLRKALLDYALETSALRQSAVPLAARDLMEQAAAINSPSVNLVGGPVSMGAWELQVRHPLSL